MVEYIFGGILLIYAIYVISKNLKERSTKKCCSNSCEGCTSCSKSYYKNIEIK